MSLTEKIGNAAKWSVPVFDRPDLDDLVRRAKTYDGVKEAFAAARGQEEYGQLELRLRYHLGSVVDENANLHRFARMVDTYDKALVPIDIVADYMKIMGGIGYGISAAKELVELPVKAAYGAYYLGKTHDLLGTLGNIVYEGLSWFLPGSLLDLTNHYVNQANKYMVKGGVERFVNEFKHGRQTRSLADARNPQRTTAPIFRRAAA